MASESLAQAGAPVVAPRRSSGVWRDAFGRLRRNKLAMIGLVLVVALFLMGAIGPFIAPHKYYVIGR